MSEAIHPWTHSILSEWDPSDEALLLSEFSYSRQWFWDSADFLISHHLLLFHLSRNSFHGLVDSSVSKRLAAKPTGSTHRTNNGRRDMTSRSSLTSIHTKNSSKIILCLLYNCQINLELFEFMLNNLRTLYTFW